MAKLRADEGSALDPTEGPDNVLVMCTRGDVHTVSGFGIYGGQYARAFRSGLREVVSPDRSSFRQYAGEKRAQQPDSNRGTDGFETARAGRDGVSRTPLAELRTAETHGIH